MAHIRKQLRDRIVTLVQAAMGITNVFTFRIDPYHESELPAVNITTSTEDTNHTTLDGTLDRAVSLEIVIARKAANGVGDSLDADCVAIENAIRNDAVVQQADLQLTSTDFDVEQGSQDIAAAQLSYTVTLFGVDDPEAVI